MSVNNGEKNFMSLEEERLMRLNEYAQYVLQSYQKFVPKISQVRWPSLNVILLLKQRIPFQTLYMILYNCNYLKID